MIGLACVTVAPEDRNRLMAAAAAAPALELIVDLESRRIQAGRVSCSLTISERARQSPLTGEWDTTGLLLARYEDVERHASALPYISGL